MVTRDELASRFAVALVARDYPSADTARFAVVMADALLARLRPEAVAPAASPAATADTPDPSAVVLYAAKCGDEAALIKEVAGVVHRTRCDCHVNPVTTKDDRKVAQAVLAYLAVREPRPAASPAPYVPKVGDVVHGLYGDDTLARITYVALNGKTGRASGFGRNQIPDSFVAFTDDTRPATPAERAAAGLPVDESAVDRVALARAIHAARLGDLAHDWASLPAEPRDGWLRAADAAIAFMAKGPAFDRAEFNEAQEREAAKVAVSRDAGDDFTRGWLARARVAAKGGAK